MPHFPIRSESDAFGWVVAVAVAALSVGILAVLTNSTVGALWGLLLIIWALTAGFRAWRRMSGAERRRLLLVTEDELHPATVKEQMGESWSAQRHDVLIVTPSKADGDPIRSQRESQGMEISLQAVKEAGAKPEARIADADPVAAAVDAHREFDPHEVIIATRAEGSGWDAVDFEGSLGDTPVSRHPLVRG